MRAEESAALRELLLQSRQAALATLDAGAPAVSMVLYAPEPRAGAPPCLLILVSRLAAHTRQLFDDPRAAVLVARPDTAATDPQALPRVSLRCLAQPLAPDDADYAVARAVYLAHLPQQAYLFGFGDFTLFRLELQEARYVGGFASAHTLDADCLTHVFAAPGLTRAD